MKAYFIKVNKQSMEFRHEFKHNFHETTFLTPTVCAHCDKLVQIMHFYVFSDVYIYVYKKHIMDRHVHPSIRPSVCPHVRIH